MNFFDGYFVVISFVHFMALYIAGEFGYRFLTLNAKLIQNSNYVVGIKIILTEISNTYWLIYSKD